MSEQDSNERQQQSSHNSSGEAEIAGITPDDLKANPYYVDEERGDPEGFE